MSWEDIRDDGGEVPGPQIARALFCSKALGKEPGASIPLEELVTPESLARWNLQEVAEILADHAPTTMVRYLSPDWAMIFLGEHSGEPILVTEPTPMMGCSSRVGSIRLGVTWNSRRGRELRSKKRGTSSTPVY